MTKGTGLGQRLFISGYNLSGDTGSIDDCSGPQKLQDVTGIDKLAMERLGGLRDGHLKWTSFFNPSVGQAHERLSAMPATDHHMMYATSTTLGDPAACMVCKQFDYHGKRDKEGALTFEVICDANGYGLEWGQLGTAGIRTDTTATNGTSVDYGATIGTTAFGLQAYLQVFAFTGTSCTVSIQSSTDNGGGDAFATVTGATFTAATGITAERIATGAAVSVERYLRVVTTGTFSNVQFAVTMVRNLTATVF